jgi:signal transduction histidine kinase
MTTGPYDVLDPCDAIHPPLTRWGHTWRVLGMLAISGAAWGPMVAGQLDRPSLLAVDLILGAVAFVAVFFRRRWPVRVAVLTGVLSAFSGIAAGPSVLAAVSLAARRVLWQVALLAAISMVAGQTAVQVQPVQGDDPYWLILTVNAVFTAGVLGWGMYIGSRRELFWTLRQRAERAEAEQGLRVEQARGTERARIAREMHDVLAHRISQISLHAGALAYRDDLTADQMRESAGVIQAKAHEALTDLRGVLGVLRDDRTGEVRDRPQPTYADVPVLVAEAREAGAAVDFRNALDGDSVDMPDIVGRTLYRIVQEGITNARKHAPGARLSIDVTGSAEDGVTVVLRNPLGFSTSGTPGAGLGLVGLSERAELRGGRLTGEREGSSFVLRGWIPWAA